MELKHLISTEPGKGKKRRTVFTRKHGDGTFHFEMSSKRDGYGVTYTEPGKEGFLTVGWILKKGTKWFGIPDCSRNTPQRGSSSVIKAARKMYRLGIRLSHWGDFNGELMTEGSARLRQAGAALALKLKSDRIDQAIKKVMFP